MSRGKTMKKSGIILFLFLLTAPAFAVTLDYNSTSKIWTLTNDDGLPYFVNATSGFQVTNDPNGFWSHNTICAKASVIAGSITSYPMNCLDKLSWTWTNSTDNKTFANVTGTATWGVARNYAVKLTMEYYLSSKDRRIQMLPTIENVGNRSTDAWIIWRSHDIKINNSKYDNWIRVWNGTQQEHRLNNSLDLSFSNLTQKSYYLHEGTDAFWAQTDWVSDTYELDIYNNGTEYNAFVDLSFPLGTLTTTASGAKKTSSKMYWIDAICTWTCSKTLAPTQIYQGSITNLNGWWGGTGTCPSSRTLTAKFANYSTYYNLASTGNLSTNDLNPQNTPNDPIGDNPAYWGVKGNDASDPNLYVLKITCDTTDSSTVNLNVSIPPPYQCANIATSTTLTANKAGVCYNITASNVVFDCNGKIINGNVTPLYHPGILMSGVNNITVKNCKMHTYSTGFWVNNSANDSFFNNTLYQFNISTISIYDDAIGFEMFNTTNTTIVNTTANNFSVNRGGTTGSGGYGYFMKSDTTNLLKASNLSAVNISGSYYLDVDHQETTGSAFYFSSGIGNSTINNCSANNLDIVVYAATGGGNLTVSNITAVTIKSTAFLFNFPVNVLDVSISGAQGSGFSFSAGSDLSNVTRVNFSGTYSASAGDAFSLSGTSARVSNITIRDTNITGCRYGFGFNQVLDNKVINSWVNNSYECAFIKGDGQYIDNMTCDYSNRSIESQLTSYYYSGKTTIANSTVVQRTGYTYETWHSAGLSYNIYLVNTTLNMTNRSMSSGDNMTVQWYVRVNVTDTTGAPLTSTINDTQNWTISGGVPINFNTPYFGYASLTPWYLVNDSYWLTNAMATSYNNHTITANNSLASPTSNTTSINITGRDWTINLTLYYTAVSYSFTISYPASTAECDFKPTLKTQTCVKCENETAGTPMYLYTNTGTGNNVWNVSLASNFPACMKYSVKTDSDSCSTGQQITTTETQLYATILPSATKSVWAYMNFTDCTPQTDTRIHNNIGIG